MMKSVVAAVLFVVVGSAFAGALHPPEIKIGGSTVQPASGTVVPPK